MNNANWDDLRFVLAVAETGSLNRAAQELGVTHATVLRRIAAFEERSGKPMFVKSNRGYTLRPDRLPIIENARRVQDMMSSVERELSGQQERLCGSVRVTSTDSICLLLMPAIVKNISKEYPDLQVSVLSGNSHLDFERLSADITIRPTLKLEDNLVGIMAGALEFALYKSPKGAKSWLGYSGPLERSLAAQWMAENVNSNDVAHVSDSFLVLCEMAAQGMGQVIMPRFVGDNDPRLVRVQSQMPKLSVPLWVASQRELADIARFRAVRERIVDALVKIGPHFQAQSDVQSG